MTAGLGHLRLPPQHFWSMTPRELAAALGLTRHDARRAPSRSELARLIASFPDRT
ncbi:MAG: phage tail assembly chaperone [Proteobacteria bacterium]|nr:phage tail assembly chaperone [Pseudomonadota bacterium]